MPVPLNCKVEFYASDRISALQDFKTVKSGILEINDFSEYLKSKGLINQLYWTTKIIKK